MTHRLSRRQFLEAALAAGTAVPAAGLLSRRAAAAAAERTRSPNERLNVAVIGVAHQGGGNLNGVSSENIVALCDIDEQSLAAAGAKFPQAKRYVDYRQMFEELDGTDLDAVVVSTPDHSHAIPTSMALRRKLAVYCEKPLTHSVWEARQIRKLAADAGTATQMGTQIHAGDNYRRVVEIVQAGVIGPVRRVHVWQGGSIDWRNGITRGVRVKDGAPPAHVHYDLWIGPAPHRPFHPSHFQFNWRYWWDFGGGQLADFGCHYMDLPFWALDLEHPTTVSAQGEKAHDGDNDCPGRMRVDYEFPARGERPAVHLTWYHGGWRPEGAEVYGKHSAVLFEGPEGRLLADYGTHKLFLEGGKQAQAVEPTIPASIGHHREWLEAIRTGSQTTCRFDYGGALTEAVLLGNVSYRAGRKRLEWDAGSLTAANCPEAAEFIRREYREGWEL
ncbi:MAG TPA: Gfo/Idh/MocA family oxidoreductase [Planctomycetaceae bacterium]|nr:Gfo/Idh/MocA family oxidoreductase [Planctomycetaceae bacterium]